jgi:Protein of unknown function (DUF2752)
MSTSLQRTQASPRRHREMLAIATGVVIFSLLLEVRHDQRVAFRGWPDFPIPETCGARTWFNTSCPGCGLTRGMIHLAHADWNAAINVHRLSGLMAFAILLQFPYRISCLRLGRPPFGSLVPKIFANVLIASLLINWVVNRLTS